MLPHLERNLELRRRVRRLLRASRRSVRRRSRRLRARHDDGGVRGDLRAPEGRARPADPGDRRGRTRRRLVPARDVLVRRAASRLARHHGGAGGWTTRRGGSTTRCIRSRSSLANGDIRLTTRFDDDNVHGILSCLHEFGHGLYERKVDPEYARTSLADGVSSAFHESQSRLWENLVGRSLSTWRFFYPVLQRELPAVRERSARDVPSRAEQGRSRRCAASTRTRSRTACTSSSASSSSASS